MKSRLAFNGFYNVETVIDLLSEIGVPLLWWKIWHIAITAYQPEDNRSSFERLHILSGRVRFALTIQKDQEYQLEQLFKNPIGWLLFLPDFPSIE